MSTKCLKCLGKINTYVTYMKALFRWQNHEIAHLLHVSPSFPHSFERSLPFSTPGV